LKKNQRSAAGQLPGLVKVWADAMYRAFAGRAFGWFGRYRRLSKDYETKPRNSETWIYVAMTNRMARFMLPQRNRDDHLLRRPRLRLIT
jgi:hypothetical protein